MVAVVDDLRDIDSAQLHAVSVVRATFPASSVMLVGARALTQYVPLVRPTYDIDLAVAVALKDVGALGELPGWSRPQEHRFLSPDGTKLDVLPVGERAEEQSLLWESGERMSLVGFDLAFEHAKLVNASGTPVLLPSAPTLALLKMRAWLDRPERTKDIADLKQLLDHYVVDDDCRRFEELAINSGMLFEELSPYLLGYDLGVCCKPHHDAHVKEFGRRINPMSLEVRELHDGVGALQAFLQGFGEASSRRE